MKILFTGKSDFQYNRVKVLTEGLKKLDNVELLFYPIINRKKFNKEKFLELEKKVDFIYIPPFRHRDVSFIRKIASKPLVFDPLISKYLTKDDYGHFWKLPFKYLLDKIPFSKADILLSDTEQHKIYFSRKFNIPEEKIAALHIGVDTSKFNISEYKKDSSQPFVVGFYGSFVPLQGTDKIIETANILKDRKDVEFQIIGDGYDFKKAESLAKKWGLTNIRFLGSVEYNALSVLINQFDICLGIFGDSKKADYVIPNKIYHYASIGKCIITKSSEGISELFTDNENIVLSTIEPSNIAEKILALKSDDNKRKKIGENSFRLITEKYNEVEIAKKFVSILKEYQKSHS
ncbi:hypothetical protein C9994_12500 [Marivirga lumbricoides]|uniref:Glycosyl transferase family 1 domain-containing protein n=1 Tax=Marivirga lumbricoides TaxID=1046115 RepID=A0A2T4DJT5_9BACT|nr:hypothetical protein C9994_12500 [Marivirga lumbricoides]